MYTYTFPLVSNLIKFVFFDTNEFTNILICKLISKYVQIKDQQIFECFLSKIDTNNYIQIYTYIEEKTINIAARGTTDPEIDSVTGIELGNNMAPITLVAISSLKFLLSLYF